MRSQPYMSPQPYRRAVLVEIPGEPVGQGRPRAAVINGKPRLYSPKNSDAWRGMAVTLMRQACSEPFIGPTAVTIVARFTLPKSKQRKRELLHRPPCTKKPDFDNIAKIVGDAGNGVLWLDDSQIVQATIQKEYALAGQPPYVLIHAWELP